MRYRKPARERPVSRSGQSPSCSAWPAILACGLVALLGAPAGALAQAGADLGADNGCPGGPVAGFSELADRLEAEGNPTVLGAEFLINPNRPCRETWVVEILTDDDEVRALLFDARTLELRLIGRAEVEARIEEDPGPGEAAHEGSASEATRDPVVIELTGGPTDDLVQGDWSDDVMTGNDGRDLFVATPGTDIVTDFDPDADLLDLGSFARPEEGLGTLRSMTDLTRHATEVRQGGRIALRIALAPGEADWSITLIGVRKASLRTDSVFFGLESVMPPGLTPTHWPERRVRFDDGSEVLLGAFAIGDQPPEGQLLSGDPALLDQVRAMVGGRR